MTPDLPDGTVEAAQEADQRYVRSRRPDDGSGWHRVPDGQVRRLLEAAADGLRAQGAVVERERLMAGARRKARSTHGRVDNYVTIGELADLIGGDA